MPKDHGKKHHVKNAAAAIADPWKLVAKIVKNKQLREEAIRELSEEGPQHKQLYSALLLKTMNELVTIVEKMSGTKFMAIAGDEKPMWPLPFLR